jgi:hypothetical protein
MDLELADSGEELPNACRTGSRLQRRDAWRCARLYSQASQHQFRGDFVEDCRNIIPSKRGINVIDSRDVGGGASVVAALTTGPPLVGWRRPDDCRELVMRGYRVRIRVPYGDAWSRYWFRHFPVCARRLLADTASYNEFCDGPWLARRAMQLFWDSYLPDVDKRDAITASPFRASVEQLRGLPEALVMVDENDVLRDEGEGVCAQALAGRGPRHNAPLQRHDVASAATNAKIAHA